MKNLKKWITNLLAFAFFATLAMPLAACGGGGGGQSSDGDKEPNATVISASLLDGKVANLLSASGIAIQDKTQAQTTVRATNTKAKAGMIVASAEETTVSQPETELVKQTESGVEDVHFHDGEKGDYTEWNEGTHHHDGQVCDVTDCSEVSDEILAEEANTPTIISLDARVNKLYNAGKFTFLCVSSAVEGEVRLRTEVSKIEMGFSQRFFYNYGAWLNVKDHYFSETDRSFTVSYMQVKAGEKSGIILVKRSDAEEGYHYSNYWSDDFNQSYIIDNETGKTYSLSSLPHIYSVRNGVIVDKTDKYTKTYQPKIENGELVLSEIVVPEDLLAKYGTGDDMLVDTYGNVVFVSGRLMSTNEGVDEYGEIREGGFIFTSLNKEIYEQIGRQPGMASHVKQRAYAGAKRYLLGNDGKIYRFDFRGEFSSVPVQVLNAQGEWSEVPKTARVSFTDRDSWFTQITVNAANMQYVLLQGIRDGKAYFANAALGADLYFTRHTDFNIYQEIGYFVGVTALPTDGSADTQMQAFMAEMAEKAGLDSKSIVFSVGATAFAYEDKTANTLVIWDRATETRQTIAAGAPIAGVLSGARLFFMDNEYMSTCFKASTESGTYYVPYKESDPTKAWSEYSQEPIAKTEKLDAYYELLTGKLGD